MPLKTWLGADKHCKTSRSPAFSSRFRSFILDFFSHFVELHGIVPREMKAREIFYWKLKTGKRKAVQTINVQNTNKMTR